MLRIILALFLLHISTLHALPSYLKGFFLQPEVGLVMQRTELTGEHRTAGGVFSSGKVKFASVRPSIGLEAGKNFIFNETFFSAGLTATTDFTKGRRHFDTNGTANTLHNRVKRKQTFSVRGIAGTQFSKAASIYAIFEILHSKFHFIYQDNNIKSRQVKMRKGLGAGVGLRSHIIGLQYIYHRYEPFTSDDMIPGGDSYHAKIKSRYHNVALTFTFPFNG